MKKKTGGVIALALCTASACTGQLPGSFRLAQQEESFSSDIEINTKIDLLWVVDNSSSMDASQEKLRNGFATFARTYMQPTWDIRVAVITTDTYLAHSAFTPYLDSVIPGTTGYHSPQINSRLGTWVNPTGQTIVNLTTGNMDSGVKFNQMVPVWGPTYAQLLPGLHDGPIPALCFEGLPYFLNGLTQCGIRDDQSTFTGTANCLSPSSGQSSITQCVNTVQNNSVRSGKAIISTMPPTGVTGNDAWTNQLIADFTVNVTTGSVGHGSERGLGSLLQVLSDNESQATAFFRPGSLRGIIFISDEEDQTLEIESSPATGFSPWSHYKCDQAGLIAMNPSANISGANGVCCTGGTCKYGADGTTCAPKTIDGVSYTPSVCANETSLKSVASIKTTVDTFFSNLDGSPTADPNYFVVSIVPLTWDAINALQAQRATQDVGVNALQTWAVDRGDRYIEFADLVGNGSLTMNIAEDNYNPILDSIGRAIVDKKGTFTLVRAPTGSEDMILGVRHADGTETILSADDYTINEKTITIKDLNIVLGFKSTDNIFINYQPKTVY